MRIKTLIFSFLSLVSLAAASLAYADASICEVPGSGEKVAGCIYLTGMNNADQQRWIKMTINGDSFTYCTGTIEQTGQYTLMEVLYPIKNSSKANGDVAICTDGKGSNCQTLASYSSDCVAGGSCTPDSLAIDISSVKNNFPKCQEASSHIRKLL